MALEQISQYVFSPSVTTGLQQYAAQITIPGRWNIGQTLPLPLLKYELVCWLQL